MNKWTCIFFLGLVNVCFGATITLVNTYQSSMPSNPANFDVSACIYDNECRFLEFELVPHGAGPISVQVKGVAPFKIQWLDLLERPIGVTLAIDDGAQVDCAKMNATTLPICDYIDPNVEE